jgi:hypothetical protein
MNDPRINNVKTYTFTCGVVVVTLCVCECEFDRLINSDASPIYSFEDIRYTQFPAPHKYLYATARGLRLFRELFDTHYGPVVIEPEMLYRFARSLIVVDGILVSEDDGYAYLQPLYRRNVSPFSIKAYQLTDRGDDFDEDDSDDESTEELIRYPRRNVPRIDYNEQDDNDSMRPQMEETSDEEEESEEEEEESVFEYTASDVHVDGSFTINCLVRNAQNNSVKEDVITSLMSQNLPVLMKDWEINAETGKGEFTKEMEPEEGISTAIDFIEDLKVVKEMYEEENMCDLDDHFQLNKLSVLYLCCLKYLPSQLNDVVGNVEEMELECQEVIV